MHIAVTGGTGFLGRYILKQLAAAGHTLRGWHRPNSDRSGLDDVKVDWLVGGLTDVKSMAELVKGVDAVVHSALDWERVDGFRASAAGDLLAFLEANFMGSIRLFEAARSAGVGRFIFISTCAVHEVILDDRPLDEAHPLWPTGHYGAHKAALEKFVHSFGLGQGWPICALRPTGIYGLAHPPSASRWYDLVGQVLSADPIEMTKGGKEVHAADVARAVELLLKAPAQAIAGQSFNCYDRYVAESEVARIARELAKLPARAAGPPRGPKHQIDTSKIRALGMTFGGEEQLRRTVAELVAAHGKPV